jgi:hypothetical protein
VPAIFLVSFASLAFEITLARSLAVSQWNHLSFMVLSVALFGFAAGGSLLSLPKMAAAAAGGPAEMLRANAAGCVLTSAAVGLAWAGLTRIPLDYYRLLVEPVQVVYLLAVYLVLTLPFFFAGAVVAIGYMAAPDRAGRVYFASMTGSALGALAPAVLLPLAGETGTTALILLAPLAALPLPPARRGSERAALGNSRRPAPLPIRLVALLQLGAGVWLLTPQGAAVFGLRPSEYKHLSQVLQFPDTRVAERFSDLRGRIERVESPHLRFAPGLSLRHTDAPPPADAVFTDGDRPFYLYRLEDSQAAGFARSTLSFGGYELVGRPRRVLAAPASGGLAVACALASGADSVRVLVPNPHLADRARRHYGIEVVRDSLRSHLARTPETFDVIHLEAWGASAPGADALQQDHLLTIEALAECLEHLTPQGVLVVSRRLMLPPAGTLRLWAAAREALARAQVSDPEACLAMLRNWDTFTLLAMRRPLADVRPLLEFARRGSFDVLWLPGGDDSLVNRFNVFDAPYHFLELRRLQAAAAQGRAESFFSAYLLDVAPQSDRRPFPGRFLKWERIGDLYQTLGRRVHALFLAGEVIVAAVFIEALLAAALLLVLPAAALARRPNAPAPGGKLFFTGIGAGFMFAELLFLHAGTFLLGEPVISLAVVVTALLSASGLGGLWAQRLGRSAVRPTLAAAGGSMALSAAALELFARELLALPEPARCAALALAVVIPGFVMGLPFSLGMRFLLDRPADRAFAWAVNGCASVLASIVSAQIAISAGFHWLLAAALASYGAALLAGRRRPLRVG